MRESETNMTKIHLHLVSDSTGETLEGLVKAGLAQFEGVDAVKHYWPMVRSEGHLDRVLDEVARTPGLVVYTLVARNVRERLELRCAALGLPVIAVMDPILAGLERMVGTPARARPGGQHRMDAAYFNRIEAISWTMEHDDGVLPDEWEEADIVLVGVSRSSKTPTSVYLANRGYKTANIPVVVESLPPPLLYQLKNPLVVGLTTSADRLIAIRRNRLLSLNQTPETDYVNSDAVAREIAFARRMFADNGWPVIDVTRRSIEETAAAIISLCNERRGGAVGPRD